MDNKINKPPGLKPAGDLHQNRMLQIQRAMNRYMAEGLPVPVGWITEYNALAHILQQ